MIKPPGLLLLFIAFFISSLSAEQLKSVSPEQLLELQNNNALIIDIRTEKEWQSTGVIPNSHKLQFFETDGKFDTKYWLSELQNLKTSPEQPVVLVCRSGNRTEKVGHLLTKTLGMKNIYHLSSGITHWIKSKHAITKSCSHSSPC